MKIRYRLLAIVLWLNSCLIGVAQVGDLPRSTPEQEGVNPALISRLYHALDSNPEIDVHHLMILRHGKVISEVHASPYQAVHKHLLYSASKTVLGLAVGLAVDDGLLSVDDKVSRYLRDKMPATLSPALDSLTVRHMLMMSSGRKEDTGIFKNDTDWLTTWFKGDFHAVGQEFSYDSMASYALSMIVCRVTGKSLLEYLRERIFEPLHIIDVDWELSPDGVELGGWGLRIQTESQAKLGQLMLQDGVWNGQQLVSKRWIHDMTQRYKETSKNHVEYNSLWDRIVSGLRRAWHYLRALFTGYDSSNYFRGYGFQTKSVLKPWGNAFFAAGYGGQLIYVMPKCDMVIVINGRAIDYGTELDAFYDDLVAPLLGGDVPPAPSVMPSFAIMPPQGRSSHELENRLFASRLLLEENRLEIKTIELRRSGDDRLFTMTDNRGALRALAACGQWRLTTSDDRPLYLAEAVQQLVNVKGPFTSAAAYAWQGDTLTFRLDWLGGGDNRRLKMAFDGDRVTIYGCDNFDRDLTDTIHGIIEPQQ